MVEEGTIADVFEVVLLNVDAGTEPKLIKVRSRLRILGRPISQFNPIAARAATSRITTIFPASCSTSSWMPTGNIPAPISRSGDDARSRAGREEAPHRREAEARSPGLKVLDIGSGWGGMALDLARDAGAEVPASRYRPEQLTVPTSARAARARRAMPFRARGLSLDHGPVRPHRLGRDVRACRRQPLRRVLRQVARSA